MILLYKYVMQRIPNINEKVHFFDDGKTCPSRHFIATVKRIVPFSDSDNIKIESFESEYESSIIQSLKEWWQLTTQHRTWTLAPETDFFVECSIPDYDSNPIWFARTKDGGWFSFDIQNSWQSGKLDVEENLFKTWEKNFPKEYKKYKILN